MIGFMTEDGVVVEHEGDENESYLTTAPDAHDSHASGPELIYMESSFFLTPESFDDDDILLAAIDSLTDDDAIWLPEDFPNDDSPIDEETFITILANYGQVRKYLHRKSLSHGYTKQKPPSGGGGKSRGKGKSKGKGKDGKTKGFVYKPKAKRAKTGE